MGWDEVFTGRVWVLIVKTCEQSVGQVDECLIGCEEGRIGLKPAPLPPVVKSSIFPSYKKHFISGLNA